MIIALGVIMALSAGEGEPSLVSILAFFAALIVGTVGSIAQTVRRLHDLDRPGSHYFMLLIPLYNLYLSLVLTFQRGTVGTNRYGDDPVDAWEERKELMPGSAF